jgi:cell division septum initiation protein DivIVA
MLTINHSIQQIVQAEYEDYIERIMAENEQMKEENEQMKEENEQMKEEIDQAKNTILNSAKAMKSAGLTVEIIEQATGLTKSEIENLK